MSLFAPGVKRQWKVIPMGDLNAATIFVVIMMKLQI